MDGCARDSSRFSRHCLHGRKFNSEVALFMNHVRGGGAKRRYTRTSCDDVYQILLQRLLVCVRATVFCTTNEARLCFNVRMIRTYARTLRVKTSFRGLAAHAYLEFAYETLSLDPRAAFLKFLFTDRNSELVDIFTYGTIIVIRILIFPVIF